MKPENIKTRFEQREIQPSAPAWDALSSRLDKKQHKNQKSMLVYWTSSVAAAIALLLGGYFSLHFNNTVDATDQQVVIEKPQQTTSSTIQVVTGKEKNAELTEQVSIVKEDTTKQDLTVIENETIDPIAAATGQNTVISAGKKLKANPLSLAVNESKNSIRLNDVTNFPKTPIYNSIEEEADQLLADALQQLTDESEETEKYSLSATQLLREAEWDIEFDRRHRIDRSLRDKLGEAKKDALAFIGINRE